MQYEAKCWKRFSLFHPEKRTTMTVALITSMNRRKSGSRLFLSRSIFWNVPSQLGRGRLH